MHFETGPGKDCVHLFAGPTTGHLTSVLLSLHDAGADETQLGSIAQAITASSDYGVLSLRGWYPRSEGFSFLSSDPGSKPDEALFLDRGARLSSFLDWAVPHYHINPQRLLCLGNGEGATLAAALLFVHSDLLGGAILIHPKNPFRPKPLPALPCYPVLLFTGERNEVELAQDENGLEETLSQCGCSVRKHRVHSQAKDKIIRKSRDWFKRASQTDLSIACAL
jgi:phospholipase/carboxylesterase